MEVVMEGAFVVHLIIPVYICSLQIRSNNRASTPNGEDDKVVPASIDWCSYILSSWFLRLHNGQEMVGAILYASLARYNRHVTERLGDRRNRTREGRSYYGEKNRG